MTIDSFNIRNLNQVRAADSAIIQALLIKMEERGAVEILPGLPGAKRPDEEIVLVGFPF
jgi:hypothetical protein